MMMLLLLLMLVLAFGALVPVIKTMFGFNGLGEAIGAWAILFILAWVL
jgi:hypothetical protein